MKLGMTAVFPLFAFLFSSCASLPPPDREYALARAALQYSEKASASVFYPQAILKAQALYKKAVSLYKRKSYERAGRIFEKVFLLAEKTEILSRVKQAREETE